MVAVEPACSLTPEGSVRWKAPEDSPEAPRSMEELEKKNGFHRIRDGSPTDRSIVSLLPPPRSRVVPVDAFAKAPSSPKVWQEDVSASSPRPVLIEPQQPPLLRSRRSLGDLAPRRHSPVRSVHLQLGHVPLIERLTPALVSARSSSSSALHSARGTNPVLEQRHEAWRQGESRTLTPRRCDPGANAITDSITTAPLELKTGGEASKNSIDQDREIRLLSDRLEQAERERNWAVVALRESECSLQAAYASAAQAHQEIRELKERHAASLHERELRDKECQAQAGLDLRLQYSRVLNEMLTVRCRGLEERLDYEAMEAVMRDAEARRAFSALEDQTARLGAALVDQQRSARGREDAIRAELMEQHRSELDRVRRELGAVAPVSLEDVGLSSSRSSTSRASEQVHLPECWDSAARQAGEPCWRLQNDTPGLLSAGLPKTPTVHGPTDQVLANSSRNSPRQQQLASPSNSPRVAHQRAETRATQSEVAIVTLQEMPASPQFGKFAADESSPPSPRSPPLVGLPRSSNPALSSVASSRHQALPREVSPPASASSSIGEQRTVAESNTGNSTEDVEAQLEDLQSSLAATTDVKHAARLWARIGTLQQRRKSFNEARQAYATAVHLDGGSQHGSLANLAQLEAHAGNVSLARDLLERAVAIDPTNTAYRAFRQWLLKEGGSSGSTQM